MTLDESLPDSIAETIRMLLLLIVACEVAFWVFLLAGLALRCRLRLQRMTSAPPDRRKTMAHRLPRQAGHSQ
jgi:hypothetical protein